MKPAFTLLELLVALVITGIVIGIAGSAMLVAVKQSSMMRSGNDKTISKAQLLTVIMNDFTHCDVVIRRNDCITMMKDNSLDVNYFLTHDLAVRVKSNMNDTFHVENLKYETYFQNNLTGQEELIDKLKLSLKVKGSDCTYFYFKKYSAQQLIDKYSGVIWQE